MICPVNEKPGWFSPDPPWTVLTRPVTPDGAGTGERFSRTLKLILPLMSKGQRDIGADFIKPLVPNDTGPSAVTMAFLPRRASGFSAVVSAKHEFLPGSISVFGYDIFAIVGGRLAPQPKVGMHQ